MKTSDFLQEYAKQAPFQREFDEAEAKKVRRTVTDICKSMGVRFVEHLGIAGYYAVNAEHRTIHGLHPLTGSELYAFALAMSQLGALNPELADSCVFADKSLEFEGWNPSPLRQAVVGGVA